MTWKELLADGIDKYEEGGLSVASLCDALSEDFWLVDWDKFDQHFRKKWISSWVCTDTRVDLALVTLDGLAIGY